MEGLFLFTYFDSQAQWSLPLSSHGLAYPYFQISLCIKETASTTWLNLEFDQKNVAGEKVIWVYHRIAYEIAYGWKKRKKKKKKKKKQARERTKKIVSSLIIFLLESIRNNIVQINNRFPRGCVVNWSYIENNPRILFFYTTPIKRTKANTIYNIYIYIYFQWIAHTFTTLKVIEVESR